MIHVADFSGTNDVAHRDKVIIESAVAPLAGDAGWSGTAPSSISTVNTGTVNFYAWTKDAAGNVSTSSNATVTVITGGGGGGTVNYYTAGDSGTSVASGISTNQACGDPSSAYTQLLSTSIGSMCASYRWEQASPGLHSEHYFNTAYAVATTVTGTSYQLTMRDGGQVGFQLFYVNTAGAKTLFGNEVTIQQSAGLTNNYIVDLSAQSTVVPAGSKLGLRTWGYNANPSFRIYLGNPDGRTSNISGHLIVEEQ